VKAEPEDHLTWLDHLPSVFYRGVQWAAAPTCTNANSQATCLHGRRACDAEINRMPQRSLLWDIDCDPVWCG
jgi:hypothetical protein